LAVSAQVGLAGPTGTGGGSSVDEFSSPAGAKSDQTQELQSYALPYPVRVSVPGVSSAAGYAGASPADGAIIAWVEGRCTLYLANSSSRHDPLQSFLKPLVAGVQAINRRTGGTCP
jgi:hypothetical protein